MHMCTYACVYNFLHMHVCRYACVNNFLHMHVYRYACVYIFYICMYICLCTCVHMHVRIFVLMYESQYKLYTSILTFMQRHASAHQNPSRRACLCRVERGRGWERKESNVIDDIRENYRRIYYYFICDVEQQETAPFPAATANWSSA